MAGPNDFLGLADPMVDLDPSQYPDVASFTDGLGEPVDLVADKPESDPHIAAMNEPPAGLDWTKTEEAKANVEASAAAMGLGPEPLDELPLPPMQEQEPAQIQQEQFPGLQLQTTEELQQPAPPPFALQDPEPSNRLLAPFEDASQRRDEYDLLSSEQQAEVFQREDDAKKSYFEQRYGDLKAEDDDAARANEAFRVLRRNEAQAEANRLRQDIQIQSEKTIDNDRWADSQSPLAVLGMTIAAGMGGFLKVMNGGRGGNSVLDAINRSIDQDIASQKADMANQRASLSQRQSLLGELRQTNADEFQADEAARIVRLNQAANAIAMEAEKYDPAGTSARAAMAMEQAVREESAKRMAIEEERLHKRYKEDTELEIKISEETRQRKKFALDDEKTQAEIAKLNRRGMGGPKPLSLRDAEFAASNGMVKDAAGNWVRDPNFTGKPLDAKESAMTEKYQAEAKIATLEAGSGPSGNPLALGDPSGSAYRNKDGSVFTVKNDGVRAQLMANVNAAKNVRRVADLTAILKDMEGGATKISGSPEYQQLVQAASIIDFETYKAFGLGAPSAGDQAMSNNAKGGLDITSFINDASAGWRAYADQLEAKLYSDMTTAGYTGKPPRMPRTEKAPKAKEKTISDRAEIVSAPVAPHLTDEAGLATDIANRRQVAIEAITSAKGPGAKYMAATNMRQDLRKAVEAGSIPNEVAWETVGGPIMQEEAKALAKRVMSEYKQAKKSGDTNAPALLERAENLKWVGSGGGTPREAWEILSNEDSF